MKPRKLNYLMMFMTSLKAVVYNSQDNSPDEASLHSQLSL